MDYISAEQFLQQSEKVQESLKKWCELNLQEHDWVDLEGLMIYIEEVKDTRKDNIDVGRVFYIGHSLFWTPIYDPDITPLITESQLRHYIEEKIKGKIDVTFDGKDNDLWKIRMSFYTYDNDDECFNYLTKEIITASDLLQAHWQVACKISEGDSND